MRAEQAAVAALAAWCAPAAAPFVPQVARLMDVPTRLESPHGIALTFDDGPHREGTPAVLQALARVGAKATFFLVGEQVERLPALAAEIAAAGHIVGIHGYRHTLLPRRPQSRLRPPHGRSRLCGRRGADALPAAVRRLQSAGAPARPAARLVAVAVVALGA